MAKEFKQGCIEYRDYLNNTNDCQCQNEFGETFNSQRSNCFRCSHCPQPGPIGPAGP